MVRSSEASEQLDLFDLMGENNAEKNRKRLDKMEAAVDSIRQKMGDLSVTLGVQHNEEIGVRREWKKKEQAPGRSDT